MEWELREAAAYYQKQGAPSDQTALIGLLREIQQENGGAVPRHLLAETAALLGAKESYLLAVIGRIPSLRLADTHLLEICAGKNCPKRRDLAAYAEKTWGREPKGFTLRYVPCMRLCGKGPNIRWDGRLYHGADEALLDRLLKEAGL